MQWQDIEQVMHTLERPLGGFTLAHCGTVTMSDGTRVFVKVGTDEETKHWAQKEIAVYLFLQKHDYPFIPKLLAYNTEKTGFALEALPANEGWDWTETWSEERLQATLTAMDTLASIKTSPEEQHLFGEKGISAATNGWLTLQNTPEKQVTLGKKLRESGHQGLAETLDIQNMATKSSKYVFQDDVIVHHDIRADNCAWNNHKQAVKLVDWNWTQIGDRAMDRSAMLVHVYRSGLPILEKYREYLHADALQWLAGFWLNASTNPVRANSPQVRDYQLASGVAALELATKL